MLGRRLSREVLNFGFAGNGHEDIGVAKYLVTLPAAVIVLDCLPNMNTATVAVKTVPIVNYLRANGHAKTPIVLAEIPPKCESDWFKTDTLQKSESQPSPQCCSPRATHHARGVWMYSCSSRFCSLARWSLTCACAHESFQ